MNSKPRIYLYGLFDGSGVCQYVGQARNMKQRSQFHFGSKRSRFHNKQWDVKVFRSTTLSKSNRIEKQIGQAYQRKGQAMESRRFHDHKRTRAYAPGVHVYAEGFTRYFVSYTHAADKLGCRSQTVKENLEGTVLYKAIGKRIRISISPIKKENQNKS